MEELADELHKPTRKIKKFRKVVSNYKNQIWSMDLVQMDDTMNEKENKGFKYILTCIDLYSRYAWAIPIKQKTGIETSNSIQKIITKEKADPEKIWTDEGKEFYNKNVDILRKKYDNIEIYSTYGVAKAAIIERFNRSLKELMYKQFTIKGNRIWFNILDEILDTYNNRLHKSLNNKSPNDVYNNNNENNIIIKEDLPYIKKSKFKLNDRVRITYKKGIFDKGYLAKWSYEIFIIIEVLNTNPITFKLISEDDNEIIKGSFYNEELQKTKQKKGVYLIEKIIKTRIYKGKKQNFVKWIGYSDSKNSWIDDDKTEHNLKNINKV